MEKSKRRIGIISSRDESCGNASFSKQLLRTLSKHYESIEIIPLDQNRIRKLGQRAAVMKEVCEQIQHYDAINIQLDFGLFGKGSKAADFVERIIRAAKGKNILITLHSPFCKKQNIRGLKAIVTLLALLKFIKPLQKKHKELKRILHQSKSRIRCDKIFSVIKECKSHSNIEVLVHRKSVADAIAHAHDITVHHHPIVIPTNEDMEGLVDVRSSIMQKYGLDPENVYVGIFGYYGAYKAFDVILNAMKYLPKNYHIIMACQVHPQLVEPFVFEPHSEVKKLNKIAIEAGLFQEGRIHYINHLCESDFQEMIAGVDVSAFMYYEIEQGGSGPLSYAVYLNNSGKVIVSANQSFSEYSEEYCNDCFTFVDQGNELELAYKIQHARAKKKEFELARQKYGCDSQAEMYVKLMGG